MCKEFTVFIALLLLFSPLAFGRPNLLWDTDYSKKVEGMSAEGAARELLLELHGGPVRQIRFRDRRAAQDTDQSMAYLLANSPDDRYTMQILLQVLEGFDEGSQTWDMFGERARYPFAGHHNPNYALNGTLSAAVIKPKQADVLIADIKKAIGRKDTETALRLLNFVADVPRVPFDVKTDLVVKLLTVLNEPRHIELHGGGTIEKFCGLLDRISDRWNVKSPALLIAYRNFVKKATGYMQEQELNNRAWSLISMVSALAKISPKDDPETKQILQQMLAKLRGGSEEGNRSRDALEKVLQEGVSCVITGKWPEIDYAVESRRELDSILRFLRHNTGDPRHDQVIARGQAEEIAVYLSKLDPHERAVVLEELVKYLWERNNITFIESEFYDRNRAKEILVKAISKEPSLLKPLVEGKLPFCKLAAIAMNQ